MVLKLDAKEIDSTIIVRISQVKSIKSTLTTKRVRIKAEMRLLICALASSPLTRGLSAVAANKAIRNGVIMGNATGSPNLKKRMIIAVSSPRKINLWNKRLHWERFRG